MSALPQPFPCLPKSEEILPFVKAIIEKNDRLRNEIAQLITPETACFDNVIRPLAELDNLTQVEMDLICLMEEVDNNEAAGEARRMFDVAKAKWRARDDLFKLIKAVSDKDEELDSESKVWLKQELLDYKLAGHGQLSQPQIEEYRKGKKEIEDLVFRFSQNWNKDTGGVWYTEEELDGLPSDDIARWKEGAKANDGNKKVFVPFANGGWSKVTRLAESEETRKKMLVAYEKGSSENAEIVRQIFLRRDTQARLLGYANHADFRMQKSAVQSTKWVEDFLAGLRAGVTPKSKEVTRKLQSVRIQDLKAKGAYKEGDETNFPPWSVSYCGRLMHQTGNFDQDKVEEYFPVETTTKALLEAFSSFLQLRFTQIAPEDIPDDCVWHKDVQIWSVWDERHDQSSFLGYLYLDLMWRENKYPGYANLSIQSGYQKPDGTRRYPATLLTTSFPTSGPEKCATLKHDQVTTLFHELGHGIHDLVSKTRYTRFHGPRMADDFGETPSVMLENWCWNKDILKTMSCHFTTLDEKYLEKWRAQHPGAADPPRQIPDDLLDHLVQSRNFNHLSVISIQLMMALFDMKVHNPKTHQQLEGLDLSTLWATLRREVRGINDPEVLNREGYPYPNFHLIVNGYDATTYAYLAADAFAQDMFQTFFAKDPGNPGVWDRYRTTFLQYGGSYEKGELKMLEDFLGRPPNVEALVQSL